MDINNISTPQGNAYGKADANQQGTRADHAQAGQASGVALSLSQASELLNKGTPLGPDWGSKFKTIPPIPRTAGELHSFMSQYVDSVRQHISKLFGNAGVELKQDVKLQFQQGAAGYSVSAAPEQTAPIEAALKSDPQLQQQLQHLQQRHDLTQLLDAAHALRQGGELAANAVQFEAQRAQQEPLTVVIPAKQNAPQ